MNATIQQWPETISKRKKNLIMQLIFRNIEEDKREEWLEKLESAYENDADEIVQSLLG